jgi:hypothetical protein
MDNEVTAAKPPFSAGKFVLGLILGLIAGGIAAFAAGFGALAAENYAVGWLIGAAPGVILALIGYRIRGRGGLGEGLLVGACITGLIGGICGEAMSGGLNIK